MSMLDTIGWRLTGLRNRMVNRTWEQRLGIHTRGHCAVNQPDAGPYSTLAYGTIFKVLRRLEPARSNTFIDIGCGKGRVVCCAATMPLASVIGIDIDAGLCAAARQNAAALRRRFAAVEVINLPAQQFDYSQCTIVFLFNPFGEQTLRAVIGAIEESLADHPRAIRLAYVNPLHETVLKQSQRFHEYDRWHRQPWSGLKFDVSFWSNAGRGSEH